MYHNHVLGQHHSHHSHRNATYNPHIIKRQYFPYVLTQRQSAGYINTSFQKSILSLSSRFLSRNRKVNNNNQTNLTQNRYNNVALSYPIISQSINPFHHNGPLILTRKGRGRKRKSKSSKRKKGDDKDKKGNNDGGPNQPRAPFNRWYAHDLDEYELIKGDWDRNQFWYVALFTTISSGLAGFLSQPMSNFTNAELTHSMVHLPLPNPVIKSSPTKNKSWFQKFQEFNNRTPPPQSQEELPIKLRHMKYASHLTYPYYTKRTIIIFLMYFCLLPTLCNQLGLSVDDHPYLQPLAAGLSGITGVGILYHDDVKLKRYYYTTLLRTAKMFRNKQLSSITSSSTNQTTTAFNIKPSLLQSNSSNNNPIFASKSDHNNGINNKTNNNKTNNKHTKIRLHFFQQQQQYTKFKLLYSQQQQQQQQQQKQHSSANNMNTNGNTNTQVFSKFHKNNMNNNTNYFKLKITQQNHNNNNKTGNFKSHYINHIHQINALPMVTKNNKAFFYNNLWGAIYFGTSLTLYDRWLNGTGPRDEKEEGLSDHPIMHTFLSFSIGLVTGVVAGLVSAPFNVIRQRMYAHYPHNTELVMKPFSANTISQIIHKYGTSKVMPLPHTLFTIPVISGLKNGLAFGIYDMFAYSIFKIGKSRFESEDISSSLSTLEQKG